MFRDLKEYQDIAKIYAEKVSKPENLEENRNQMAMKLRQEREANKPPETPKVKSTYQSNRDKMIQSRSANRPKSREEVGLKPKQSQGRVSRSSQNMSGKPKPMPTTAEIRAKNPNVVPGTRVNEIGAKGGGKPSSGDLSMFKDKKPEPQSKFIKKDKGVGFVKRGTPMAQRAENKEKNKMRAQEMAKKRIADKKAGNASPQLSGKERAQQMAKDRLAKKAAMEEFTPYDIVLEYLLSSEQAATIEEANYVMTEMDGATINSIVKEFKE